MISKLKLLDKYLNYLLIFLFPTQLAIHFWPTFALVFGIRVDYLSPSIYFTDILFISLFFYWGLKNIGLIRKEWNRNKLYAYLLIGLCILNIFASSHTMITFFKWLKIAELFLLAYYVKSRTDIFNIKNISIILFYSLVFFSAIGILQFIRGKTLGNIFYLLGERKFSLYTPGIALQNLFGKNYLRAYSTFSHPNSLAGYYAVSLIFLSEKFLRKKNIIVVFGLAMIVITLLLSFSLSAYIGLFACALFSLFIKKHFNSKIVVFVLFGSILLSFGFAAFSGKVFTKKIFLQQNIYERIELAKSAGELFSDNWAIGIGLNSFVPEKTTHGFHANDRWLLQPVHNIFLLIASETGLAGIIIFSLLLTKIIYKTKNKWALCVIVFVLITGLFDHYWLTLQQNMFLIALLFGIFSREK